MEDIFEFIAALIGSKIYGTEARPRHPFWRNSFRFIAFLGLAVAVLYNLDLLNGFEFPLFLVLLWGFVFFIVFISEYHFGSRKIMYATFAAFPIFFISLFLGTMRHGL